MFVLLVLKLSFGSIGLLTAAVGVLTSLLDPGSHSGLLLATVSVSPAALN